MSTKKQAEKQQPEEPEEMDDKAEETSDLESTFFKMMRMQYGVLAGGAKGMTEMAKMMETFLDTLADETELKTNEDWRELIENTPDAMVTATRKALNKGDQAAQEVIDTYRRYSEAKDRA